MNKIVFIKIAVVLASIAGMASCFLFEEPNKGSNDKFLLLQTNSEKKLADGAQISLLEVNRKGEAEITSIADVYPPKSLRENADIFGERIALGLHRDFNTDGLNNHSNGGWFDIAGEYWYELPLLQAGRESLYSYYDVSTTKVSKSGHIFYHSSTNNKYYGDEYRPVLVRYNPKTEELDAIYRDAVENFVLNQPEKGADTETGQITRQFYPSLDGRYVYGQVDAYGVNFGSLHWDYKLLFKYDFETGTFTRLGDVEDRNVGLLGITADKEYVAFSNYASGKYTRKIVKTSTNETNEYSLTGGQGFAHPSRWNNNGYCSGETNNTIGVYDLKNDMTTTIKTQARPYYAQFSKSDDFIYFMVQNSESNYLCKTSNLSETATIDTVCALPLNLVDFLVIP